MYCTISIIEIPHTIQEKITAFITGAATLGIICKNFILYPCCIMQKKNTHIFEL